ncbi:MAG: DUF4301 family protein [Paludibacteraceae bacterium]|nr:DUF4301 family protein [Paludibacteraceae bacterium]
MFTQTDKEQLSAHGISLEKAQMQMQQFRTGFPELDIVAACTPQKGILTLNEEEQQQYLAAWDNYLNADHDILKFVPASGAASRMFKNLFEYLETGEETEFIKIFLAHKDCFAFGNHLKNKDGQEAVRYLLEDMHYGTLPKGLLLFHNYADGPRTPALEHLVEGALYAKNKKGEVNIHFTVSHEHRELFAKHIEEHKQEYEKRYNCHINVSFSEQKPSTDTIAADADCQPFHDKKGNLVLRPGGHGALIENLGEQNADVVFIKNIDNVVPDRLKADTVHYKKLIAGVLVSLQAQAFAYLRELEAVVNIDKMLEIKQFIENQLCYKIDGNKTLTPDLLRHILNRPIRVCGMVRNEGEPGGGPFLVRRDDNDIQCQILESSQIADKSLMQTATHFNPVDLVCGLKDYRGNRFDLSLGVDPKTGFISQKSKDGRELQALELPGLWNGAMAKWNTVFVEVPVSTFNPVKTVNDLLRDQHR